MNVLMIGMGMVARTHVMALRDNTSGLRLGAVLGRDAARTDAFCDEAGLMLGYDVAAHVSLDDALVARPDLALVLTPPNARLEYARSLATAGIPTLFEKPLERTMDGARTVLTCFETAGVPMALCFQHRTRAAAQALKAQLDSGALGEVVHVEMRVPWWRDQSYYDVPGRGTFARDGGGVMINQAIHTLDLGLWLVGSVVQVQALMRTSPLHRMEAEDIAVGLLEFACGASGVLSASTAAYPGGAESISITTTRAQVTLAGDDLTIAWMDGRVSTHTDGKGAATGGGADPMAFTHAWHQAVIEGFAQAVRAGTAPLATGHEALHVHAVIGAMERAARTGTKAEVGS
ncbi:Gfo/Idh/MocA family protein [Tateyamaria sp.]|uniref:Gfo/Idh/MocA family protein n=1 Tax=Tateyamaria sp. TaxID=1929288 RepID=UPI003B21F6F9